jgi:hypothetical protein
MLRLGAAAVPSVLIAGPAFRVVAVILLFVSADILLAILLEVAFLFVIGHFRILI